MNPQRDATRPDVVHLSVENKDGHVVVTPSDKDRFVLKMQMAVRACQFAHGIELFEQRLKVLLGRLAEWLSKHEHSGAAWLTIRDAQWVFVVVRKHVEYDREFEDALSTLELEIASDSDLEGLPMSTMALPMMSPDCVRAFVDPSVALVLEPPTRVPRR